MGIPLDSFNNSMEKLVDNAFADAQLITTVRLPSTEETEKFLRYAYEGKSIDF